MLRKFFRGKRETAAVAPAAMPPGVRAYAIGDVHGRLDLLDQLIESIDADDAARGASETHLIFLGDLIDRGPESAQVIDRVIGLAENRPNVTVLTGNHEEVFLLALEGDRKALRFFTRIGGRETLISYGISAAEYADLDFDELAVRLLHRVPARHIDFLRRLDHVKTMGDYLFVHAGIRPGVPLAEQNHADLHWIRDTFLDHQGYEGFVVVHGHTPSVAVEQRSNRMGIDTGAWESGCLTALGLEGNERWLIDTLPDAQSPGAIGAHAAQPESTVASAR